MESLSALYRALQLAMEKIKKILTFRGEVMTTFKQITMRILIALGVAVGSMSSAIAQHRGDPIAFQGISLPAINGVKALAMGGAYTSASGDINSLFWNPAGLASIDGLSISITGDSYKKSWQENQIYRPNRQFVSLGFILDGMLVPDPSNNGLYDHDVFKNDTNYVVNDPILGMDHFSKEAADWTRETDAGGPMSIVIGLPVNLLKRKFYIAAAVNKKLKVQDYDRNQTYITPHLGYFQYEGEIVRVTDPLDSIRVHWSDYERVRTGDIWSYNVGIGMQLNENVSFGLGFEMMDGETDDSTYLNRVGYFDLIDANLMAFSYDTLNTSTSGTSKFGSSSLSISTLINYSKISIGLKINPGYIVKREWNYTNKNDTLETAVLSGTDEMNVAMGYALGVSIQPTDFFRIAGDISKTNHSSNEFTFASQDTTHRGWADQFVVGIGIEYKPFSWISLMSGYRSITETFIPDGAAITERGPSENSFTAGASIKILKGYLDVAFENRSLKYYDQYFSNTNYALNSIENISIGYRYVF